MNSLCAKIVDGHNCACGEYHNSNIRLYEQNDLERVLLKLMPHGSHVLYAGRDEQLKKRLGLLYRVSALFFEGHKHGEDIRLVISDGEDYAKYVAHKLRVPHVIIGADFEQTALVSLKNSVLIEKCSPPVVICNNDEINTAEGFASVMLRYLSLFDWDISALLFDKKVCPLVFKEAKKTIYSLFNCTATCGKNSPNLKKAIIESKLRLSILGASVFDDCGGLFINGAIQAAAAMEMLFKHESRELKPFSENAFLLSGLVARCYAAFLEFPPSFCPPPDNNLRLSRISEYLGLDEYSASKLLPPPPEKEKTELIDYRLRLYRTQLKEQLYDVNRLLSKAFMVYLKLNHDDGYSLKNYISGLDSSLCIGLGSDILHGNTLLAYMRHKGVLDKYVL